MRISVHLSPRAKTTRIRAWKDGILFVSVHAPPADQAANKELLTFLATVFQLSRQEVVLVAGATQKHKIIDTPLSVSEIEVRVKTHLATIK